MTDEDTGEPLDPIEELKQLKNTVRLNKIFLLITLAISMVCISVLLTATAYFYKQLSAITTPPPSPFEQQIQNIEKNLKSLSKLQEADSNAITSYHLRVNRLQEECNAFYSPQRIQLILQREQDYQQLLDEIITGTQQLADMSKGTYNWLPRYHSRLEALKTRSQNRSEQWQDRQ